MKCQKPSWFDSLIYEIIKTQKTKRFFLAKFENSAERISFFNQKMKGEQKNGRTDRNLRESTAVHEGA